MTHEHRGESFEQAKEFLGKKVALIIDRQICSLHPEHKFLYTVNYGYIPNTLAPDGEGIDAYFLGTTEPVREAGGVCIAIVHRIDDNDDSIVVIPEGFEIEDQETIKAVSFQEQYFDFKIIR